MIRATRAPKSTSVGGLQARFVPTVILGQTSLLAASQENPNIKLAQVLYDAFAKGEIPKIIDASAPDVTWEVIGCKQDCPYAGKFTCKAGVAVFFKAVGETWDFKEFVPREFLSSGASVVVQGRYQMIQKMTGKNFQSEWVHIFTFKDGKLASFREFTDAGSMANTNLKRGGNLQAPPMRHRSRSRPGGKDHPGSSQKNAGEQAAQNRF